MIKPTNNHLLIDPVAHEGFMSSQRETYEEIGIVLAVPKWMANADEDMVDADHFPKVGDKVYFDSWLAAKYPKEGDKPDEFYWLVKWDDIRAVEHVDVAA